MVKRGMDAHLRHAAVFEMAILLNIKARPPNRRRNVSMRQRHDRENTRKGENATQAQTGSGATYKRPRVVDLNKILPNLNGFILEEISF